jgi:chromate reductase, NAD(P)H dehydrogenase (quinone)
VARILLISGSTRGGSTNTALLRTAAAAAPAGIEAVLYAGMTALPHFNPDDDAEPLPAPVRALRAQIAAADAVLLCTPEYAGAMPGSFKNLLDWTVGGIEMYRKPVAWVRAAPSPERGHHAHESLATVLGYLHSDIVHEACVHIGVAREMVGEDGTIADPGVRGRIAGVLQTLAAHVPAADPARPAG